jgi:hypothetical protein
MSSTAVDPHLQSQSYSFIPKLLKDELSGLRTAVQMASKAEKNCPLSQKPARTAEREMLEMELGRLRTKIERGEREAKERDVLARAKKEENEKRKEGKGAWYMKRSEFLCAVGFADARPNAYAFRRAEGSTPQSPIREPGTKRWSESSQEGFGKEEEEDGKQGEKESSVCKGLKWGGWWFGRTGWREEEAGCLITRAIWYLYTCCPRA